MVHSFDMRFSWLPGLVLGFENLELARCLKQLVTVWPSDRDWNESISSWNVRQKWTPPAVVVIPLSAEDVANSVVCARQQKMTVVPKAGGHSYESLGSYGDPLVGSIQIDMQMLSEIRLKKESEIAHVGPGAKLGKLYYKLYRWARRWFPPGLCPTLGVGGFTLGGGLGFWSRYWGLASDHIMGMTGVLANGTIVDIDDKSHPDLFWALKGSGGGNFAVVTDFALRTERAPDLVAISVSTWGLDDISDIACKLVEKANSVPRYLGWELLLYYDRVELWITLLNPNKANENDIPKLLNILPPPKKSRYETLDFLTAYQNVSDRLEITHGVEDLNFPRTFKGRRHQYSKKKSLMIRRDFTKLKKSTCDYLQNVMKSASPGTWVVFELYGGKVGDLSPKETAFVHRDTEVVLSGVLISDQPLTKESEKWLADWWQRMRWEIDDEPYHSYVNYMDTDLVEDWAEAFYGENLDRLKRIRQVYDPDRMFNGPCSIAKTDTAAYKLANFSNENI